MKQAASYPETRGDLTPTQLVSLDFQVVDA